MTYPQDIINSPRSSDHIRPAPFINSDVHDLQPGPSSINRVPRSPSPPINFKALRRIATKYLPQEPWLYDDQDDTVYPGSFSSNADLSESDLPAVYHQLNVTKETQQGSDNSVDTVLLEPGQSLLRSAFEPTHQPTAYSRDKIPHKNKDKDDPGPLLPIDFTLRDGTMKHIDSDRLASYTSESFVLGSDSTLGNNEPEFPLLNSSSYAHIPSVMPLDAAIQVDSNQEAQQGGKMDEHGRENAKFQRPLSFAELSHPNDMVHRSDHTLDDLVFRRSLFRPPASRPSLLQLSLQNEDNSTEDFVFAKYVRIGCSDGDHGFPVVLYYPDQVDPQTKAFVSPIQVWVQPEATMEELIGYGVYSYVKRFGRAPMHPRKEKAEAVFNSRSWMLRMVENGSIDDDYPAIDYGLIVGDFGEHEFALCPVTSGSKQLDIPHSTDCIETVTHVPAVLNATPRVLTMLQIMVVPMGNSQIQVQISPDATIRNVLEQVCHDCNMGPMNLYALLCQNTNEILSPNQVASNLEFRGHDLVLVERASLEKVLFPSRDNHAQAVLEEPKYKTAMDMISNYKAYSVSRRHHIAMGRHERVISLDGEWLHIIRPAEKRVTHAKSTSYLLSSIVQCELNPRIPHVFRLVVHRERTQDTKRYEFEAEDAVRAQEIVDEINQLRRQ